MEYYRESKDDGKITIITFEEMKRKLTGYYNNITECINNSNKHIKLTTGYANYWKGN